MKLTKEEIQQQAYTAKEMAAKYLKDMLEAGIEPDLVAEATMRVTLSILALIEGSVIKGGIMAIGLAQEISMEMVQSLRENPFDEKGERFALAEAQPVNQEKAEVDKATTEKHLKDFLN